MASRIVYPVIVKTHFFHHKIVPAFVQIDLSGGRTAQVRFENRTREDFVLQLPSGVFATTTVPLGADSSAMVEVRDDAPVGVYEYQIGAPRTGLEAKGSSRPDIIIVR
jgi:hypothetical protein